MTPRIYRTVQRMMEESVFQAKRANTVAAEARQLGTAVNRDETRLGELRAEADRIEAHLTSLRGTLADKHEEMLAAAAEAEHLRAMVERECAENDWEVPKPPSEVPLRNTDTFPAVAAEPPRTAEQIRAAVDDLTVPPHGVSVMCFEGVCKADPEACEGCEHDCHWLPPAAEKPQEAENTRPDPAPAAEKFADWEVELLKQKRPGKAEARVRSPRALLLALYVRMLLAERGEGRHAGRRRVFKHRALVEVV